MIVVKIIQTTPVCTDYNCLYEYRVKQMFRINIAVQLTTLLIPTQQLSTLAIIVALRKTVAPSYMFLISNMYLQYISNGINACDEGCLLTSSLLLFVFFIWLTYMVIYGNIYPYMANTESLVLRYTIYRVTIQRPISLTNLTRENCLL